MDLKEIEIEIEIAKEKINHIFDNQYSLFTKINDIVDNQLTKNNYAVIPRGSSSPAYQSQSKAIGLDSPLEKIFIKPLKQISLFNILIMIFHYIKYLYNFFIGFSIGVLLNDYFDRQFPNEHKIFTNQVTNLFVNVSYNCIYYFET